MSSFVISPLNPTAKILSFTPPLAFRNWKPQVLNSELLGLYTAQTWSFHQFWPKQPTNHPIWAHSSVPLSFSVPAGDEYDTLVVGIMCAKSFWQSQKFSSGCFTCRIQGVQWVHILIEIELKGILQHESPAHCQNIEMTKNQLSSESPQASAQNVTICIKYCLANVLPWS